MTAQPDPADFRTDERDLFARARNDWLDRFSRLEIAVLTCAVRLGAKPSQRVTPFGQRLKELRSLEANSKCSTADLEKLQSCIRECERLLPVRATVVHSVIQIGQIEGRAAALFRNNWDVANGLPGHIVMTEADFRCDRAMFQSLTDRIDQLGKRTHLPPSPRA